jgi:hypothetical protein
VDPSDSNPGVRSYAMRLMPQNQAGLRRAAAAVALGCVLGGFVLISATSPHPPHTEWDQIYAGAQVFLGGGNPYTTVRHDQYPSYYPATAFLVAAPLIWLPFIWAQAAWAGLGTWAFASAMSRRGAWGFLALASAPFLNAVLIGQWSPLLVGASAFPWLAVVWAAKPTIGAALFVAYPSRLALAIGVGLVALSLAIRPDWPAHWLDVLRISPHLRAPITRPGGVLLLLGLLRWRTAEGRLIAALSLVPQTTMAYDVLPLFLIPRSARQMATLVVLSQLAFFVAVSLPGVDPAHDLAGTLTRQWPVWLFACYLPARAFVLRSPLKPRLGADLDSDAPAGGAALPDVRHGVS